MDKNIVKTITGLKQNIANAKKEKASLEGELKALKEEMKREGLKTGRVDIVIRASSKRLSDLMGKLEKDVKDIEKMYGELE